MFVGDQIHVCFAGALFARMLIKRPIDDIDFADVENLLFKVVL
jgi:hypothetical protein